METSTKGCGSIKDLRTKQKSQKRNPLRPKIVLSSLSQDEIRHRTASLMWDAEHDPFQVFEVEHESCWDLEIHVKHGEGITKGSVYQDLCDTPDPYVILKVPGSSNSSKRTSHIDNTVHPIWNETFHFFLDPNKSHILHISLMDANLIMSDELIGENILDINSLQQDTVKEFVIEFTNGSKLHMTIMLQKDKNPDLRFSLALCEEEKKFLRLRRQKVMQSMQKLLGEKGPAMEGEVPVVAILGSGGGFRAMTCLSGAVKALHESKILSCATYISGLSGSSWLISTLYAHDKFPNVTYDEIHDELRKSVTQNWKWNLAHSYRYVYNMILKHRGGQPVSFTDIFGHLLGDVLLQGQKTKKLSDQRTIVEQGNVPFPLYTCLHAKASVSCKAFSEWIEFSPYEIGIAKYGTFMKTEDFGSKFIVGKLIKKFPEFPLHYLQGVWGSAFTILMRRLVLHGDSAKKDIVQMMRDVNEERAINDQLEEEYLGQDEEDSRMEKESETDDEADVVGADDHLFDISNLNHETIEEKLEKIRDELRADISLEQQGKASNLSHIAGKSREDFKPKKEKKLKLKTFSFEFPKIGSNLNCSKNSIEVEEMNARKISSQSDPGIGSFSPITNMDSRKQRIRRQGAIRQGSGVVRQPSEESTNYWQNKREERRSRRTKKSSIIQELMKSSNILNSRVGRAGEILNPFRGLSLKQSFPLSPFEISNTDEEPIDETDLGLGCRYESLDNKAKKLFIVDSGLAFNSPYPLLMRPQRAVDIYLSFDFSQRPSDRHMPFKELIIAEKWARQNKVPFPPIREQVAKYTDDGEVKELYVFKDDSDPTCPVILHFTIVNNRFKWEKSPNVPRETKEELEFADFSLFDDPLQPYASTNFVYEQLQFERLIKLVEYNTLLGIPTIKDEIAQMVEKKRSLAITPLDHTFLKMKKLMNVCKMFPTTNGMQLKVDKAEGNKIMSAWKRAGMLGKVSRTLASSIDDNSFPFYDAKESLESCEEESDYHTDDEENDESQSQTEVDISLNKTLSEMIVT